MSEVPASSLLRFLCALVNRCNFTKHHVKEIISQLPRSRSGEFQHLNNHIVEYVLDSMHDVDLIVVFCLLGCKF